MTYAQGALGIVINQADAMDLVEVFQQLSLAGTDPGISKQPVLRAAAVQTERGFVLHEPTKQWDPR